MSAKKAKVKKKYPKFAEAKKPIIIGSAVAVLAIAGIIIGINFSSLNMKHEVVLYYGVTNLPYTIDPIDMTDTVDSNVITQVAESLFEYGENSEIINGLATSYEWSTDDLNLTCTLRQGVKFHDETPFNATAVKWNFDRAYRLIGDIWFSWLWLLPDFTPIINETLVLDEYNVRFVLNAPYAPFLSLLASAYSCIISPIATPADKFIDVATGDLVGTGPFIYDFRTGDYNLTLSANSHYWDGRPKIDKLIFIKEIRSPTWLDALLTGEIHMMKHVDFNESTLDSLKSNPSFNASDPIPIPFVDYIVMNNKLINITMRRAISYAVNYSSYLLLPYMYVKAKGPIPEGILYCYTSGINAPYYDITLARQILIDRNWNGTLGLTANGDISPGNPWESKADSSTPLARYNYSACYNWPRTYMYGDRLVEDLKQIGVKVEPFNLTYAQWSKTFEERDRTELGYDFWYADYNDPANFIDEFYTNKKIGYNMGQVNDTQVQELMEDALIETNVTARRQLYYQIQERLIEQIYPNVWLNSWVRIDVYTSKLIGWNPHPFKDLFKSVEFD